MSNPAGNPLKKLKTVINDLNGELSANSIRILFFLISPRSLADVTIKVEVVIIAPAFDTELTASISPGHSRTFNLSGLGSALNFYDLPGGEPVNVPYVVHYGSSFSSITLTFLV
jgi:hypothetical protein